MNVQSALIDPKRNKLNISIRGRGPDLVLLHGWGLNLRVWDRLTDTLAEAFRVIAVDLPGHGLSAWDEEARGLAGLASGVDEAISEVSTSHVLLGWSLGGQIALHCAASEPERLERLVLVSTTPRFVAQPDWPHGIEPELLRRFAEQLATDYRRTVNDFLELQVRGSASGANVLQELRTALLEHGEARPEALTAGLNALAQSDLRPLLHGIRVPTLVVAGQYDRVTPPSASRALAEALPNARYVEIRRAAHAPFLSHPVEFAQLLTDCLRDHPS